MLIVNSDPITDINLGYKVCCGYPGDTREHLPTLYRLSLECKSIVELGIRVVISTWAFLKGLKDNNSPEKRLISVDLQAIQDIPSTNFCGEAHLSKVCNDNNIDFRFIKGDSTRVNLPVSDMIFIDTFHVYGQLKRELSLHCDKARKYIVMHDTAIDAIDGECIRMGMDIDQIMKETGFPREDLTRGLL